MNVTEHVDDDGAPLRFHAVCAGTGTRFIVSVPAFGFL
jgi:hypothetical protein